MLAGGRVEGAEQLVEVDAGRPALDDPPVGDRRVGGGPRPEGDDPLAEQGLVVDPGQRAGVEGGVVPRHRDPHQGLAVADGEALDGAGLDPVHLDLAAPHEVGGVGEDHDDLVAVAATADEAEEARPGEHDTGHGGRGGLDQVREHQSIPKGPADSPDRNWRTKGSLELKASAARS